MQQLYGWRTGLGRAPLAESLVAPANHAGWAREGRDGDGGGETAAGKNLTDHETLGGGDDRLLSPACCSFFTDAVFAIC